MKVAVIGSGKMGAAYRQAVNHLNLESHFDFYKKNHASEVTGAFSDWLSLDRGLIVEKYDAILLAIPVDQYLEVITKLGDFTDCFFLEKPGFSDVSSYLFLNQWAHSYQKKIFVLFNRRFFSSVQYLKSKLQVSDHYKLEVCFDDRISKLSTYSRPWELRYWVWFNSVHMIDLAFWLVEPAIRSSNQIVFETTVEGSKKVDWHEGLSKMRASFGDGRSELLLEADWTHDGSWAIDGHIDNQLFYMRPIEAFVSDGCCVGESDLDPCKPGLSKIIENIVNVNHSDFATLEYCRELYERICKIANY